MELTALQKRATHVEAVSPCAPGQRSLERLITIRRQVEQVKTRPYRVEEIALIEELLDWVSGLMALE